MINELRNLYSPMIVYMDIYRTTMLDEMSLEGKLNIYTRTRRCKIS